MLRQLWAVLSPFVKFERGKGTTSTLIIGVVWLVLQQQFGIDLAQVVEHLTPIKEEVVKGGWAAALAYFFRRALG